MCQVPLYAVVGEKEIDAASLSLMCRNDGGLLDLGALPYEARPHTQCTAHTVHLPSVHCGRRAPYVWHRYEEAINKMEVASKTGAAIAEVLSVDAVAE